LVLEERHKANTLRQSLKTMVVVGRGSGETEQRVLTHTESHTSCLLRYTLLMLILAERAAFIQHEIDARG
jgi:hypothetical protein